MAARDPVAIAREQWEYKQIAKHYKREWEREYRNAQDAKQLELDRPFAATYAADARRGADAWGVVCMIMIAVATVCFGTLLWLSHAKIHPVFSTVAPAIASICYVLTPIAGVGAAVSAVVYLGFAGWAAHWTRVAAGNENP